MPEKPDSAMMPEYGADVGDIGNPQRVRTDQLETDGAYTRRVQEIIGALPPN